MPNILQGCFDHVRARAPNALDILDIVKLFGEL